MHTCPRRINEYGPWERSENLDDYLPGHGLIGQMRGCTFCGSMEPNDFLVAVRTGAEVGPTDKSYKFYIRQTNPEPEKLHPISAGKADKRGDHLVWLSWDEMNPEQIEQVNLAWGHDAHQYWTSFGWGVRPDLDSKFYTMHLSPEQGDEFIAFWDAGQINWGYPGYPYVRLYIPRNVDR